MQLILDFLRDYAAGITAFAALILAILSYYRKGAKIKGIVTSYRINGNDKSTNFFIEVKNIGDNDATITHFTTRVDGNRDPGHEIIGENTFETERSLENKEKVPKRLRFDIPYTLRGHRAVVLRVKVYVSSWNQIKFIFRHTNGEDKIFEPVPLLNKIKN